MEYMSEEGYNKILAELKQLESVELPRVRDAIAEARAQGDLSENFEYHAAKREQGRILSRIRFKQRVLEHARVIDRNLLGSDTVGLLSKVELTNIATQGKMSIKSPIAQALKGRKTGDTISISVPAGTLQLRIDSITLG